MESQKYFSVKVNAFFVRLIHNDLKILTIKKKGSNYWELPNTFLLENEKVLDACERTTSQVINHLYIGNYKYKLTNVITNKDILEINYLSLDNKFNNNFFYNKKLKDLTWLTIKDLNDNNILDYLNFYEIFDTIIKFIKSDYANINYFIKNKFTLSELQNFFIKFGINDKQFHEKRNFRKWLFDQNKENIFIKETNFMKYGNHRPAKLYSPLYRIEEKEKK